MFRDSAKQTESAINFLEQGWQNREKALIVGPNPWVIGLLEQLETRFPETREKIRQKEIEPLNYREIYLSKGEFSAERVLFLLETSCQQALANGFQGVRVIAEMSWSPKAESIWEDLFTYEARMNEFMLDKPIKFYCIYHPSQFPAKQLYRAMLTHPYLENDHYSGACPTHISPAEFLEEQRRRHFDAQDMNRTGKQFIVVEQAPLEKERSLADQMLDNIKDAILVVSPQGEIRYMNQSGQKRYGNQVNRICHQSIFQNLNPCPICQLFKHMTEGKDRVETEIQDERGAHINLVAYRFSSASTQDHLIVYLRDVTGRKKWEEESAFLDKFASLGYLSSGIAHELNNNLTPILIYSQMLGQSDLPEAVRQKAQKIETCATASKRLVESLTDFSQKIPHKKDFANLNKTIQKTIDLMEYRLTASNIDVILELDPELPGILVDELKIQQVFSNLITNAYQAMQDSGGKISISSSFSNGWCKFEIIDSGPGIPAEIRSKIFDPFFTTRQMGDGKGLGLSTSYGIVAAHQGKLSFESKENVGTAFTIELPVVAASEKAYISEQHDQTSQVLHL